MKTRTFKIFAFSVASILVATGTYNAVVIGSDSHLSQTDVKLVKHLDEMYGVTTQGRKIAASWHKLEPKEVKVKTEESPIEVKVVTSAPTYEKDQMPAEVQEELSLSLIEVINQNIWQNGLKESQFAGALSTKDGVIEELSVSLPGSEGISVSFAELSGNVFEYDYRGDIYTGMLYQVDQHSYMVTLTTGPLEGTRLRFSNQGPTDIQETQDYLAENNNINVGTFGDETPALSEGDFAMNQEAIAPEMVQGFNI
jgi:hypothetical protein